MSVFPFSKLRTLLDTFGCLFTCDGWRRKICGAVDFTYSGHSQGNPQTEPEVSPCHRNSTHPDHKTISKWVSSSYRFIYRKAFKVKELERLDDSGETGASCEIGEVD